MDIGLIFRTSTLLFVLLNPFLMSIYLIDLIQDLDFYKFARVLVRGACISTTTFSLFAWVGDAIFTDVLQARFASFLIFGGIIFLIIGIRFVFVGSQVLRNLRGDPDQAASSIAMPFMIGPGTLSASVLIGQSMAVWLAVLTIIFAMAMAVTSIVLLKWLHDSVRKRNEQLVERYIDITGRMMALVIGTYAIEMILRGIESWIQGSSVFR
jgi:small neutral amino acid transporter SnatA (MarC family)